MASGSNWLVVPLLVISAYACFIGGTQHRSTGFYPTWDDYTVALTSFANFNLSDLLDVQDPVGIPFRCQPLNKSAIRNGSEPQSVHELTPADVDVVAAMGDSLTVGACAGAESLINCLWQYHDRAFSIGGGSSNDTEDNGVEKYGTLPNIIREYNPGLTGYARGIKKVQNIIYPDVGLNVAFGGANAKDLTVQANDLIDKMGKRSSGIDVDNDWKLVTIFIGANDLCRYCMDNDNYPSDIFTTEAFKEFLKQALDILFEKSPRTLVNLVLTLDVPQVVQVHGIKCEPLHWLECPCAALGNVQFAREQLAEYHEAMWDLVASGRYDQPNRTDFTVVIQSVFHSSAIPLGQDGELDETYFGQDCFHFSSKTHSLSAKSVWNNMFEPVGNKSLEWDIEGELFCPSEESPFFYTNLNSGEFERSRPPWDDISNAEPVDQPYWEAVVDLMEFALQCLTDDDPFDPYYREEALRILDTLIPEYLRDDFLHSFDNQTEFNFTCDDFTPDPPSQEPTYKFECEELPPSAQIPKSVHELRPGDIKVVAAMGDSLTAGSGADARTFIGSLYAWRGISFSIGGDNSIESVVTLPNFLRKYNPKLKGYSVLVGPVENIEKSHLNVAYFGALAGDMLEQAKELVSRMKADKTIDFEEDWKVVTVFAGGNDLCGWCIRRENISYQPEEMVRSFEKALDYLHQEMPRTFVNLLQVLNVPLLEDVKGAVCKIFQGSACRCAIFEPPLGDINKTKDLLEDYKIGLAKLIESGKYDSREDFTVVIQPFTDKATIPLDNNGEIDKSYLAADCFHFNRNGHLEAAEALWNNMFEPVNSKREEWQIGYNLTCPSKEHPFLYTNKNSGVTTELPPAETTSGNIVTTEKPPAEGCPKTSESSVSREMFIGVSCAAAFASLLVGILIGYLVGKAGSGNKNVSHYNEEGKDNNAIEMNSEKSRASSPDENAN